MEAGLLNKMTACLSVYKAISMRNEFVYTRQKTSAEFKKNYPQYAVICKEIKELRERINGES